MQRRPLLAAAIPATAAAILGNAFVGKDALTWFRGLRKPRLQLPMPAFLAVAVIYYALLGTVLYRAAARDDIRVRRLALAVLAGNEAWNAVFFGRRSTRDGFLGLLLFLPPLAALQRAARTDPTSAALLAPYTAFVLAYDLPWAYRLWRLNRSA